MRKQFLNKVSSGATRASRAPARTAEHDPIVLIEEDLAHVAAAGTRPGACVSSGMGVRSQAER